MDGGTHAQMYACMLLHMPSDGVQVNRSLIVKLVNTCCKENHALLKSWNCALEKGFKLTETNGLYYIRASCCPLLPSSLGRPRR